MLQPCNDHIPGARREGSADPLVIPPVAHILACADEQRAGLRGTLGVRVAAIHGNGNGDEMCSSRCKTSGCRGELNADPSLAPCAAFTSTSSNAHVGSAAALCKDHGLVQSVQLPHASVRRSHSAGLPVQWPDSGASSTAVSFKPRDVTSGIQGGGSLDAGSVQVIGGKTCTLQSVSVQTQTISAALPPRLQHASVQETGDCTTSFTVPTVSMVDKGVQAALLSEHVTSCHKAVQATAICANIAVQCTPPLETSMAHPASLYHLEPSKPIRETALPAVPPCAGAAERVRQGVAAVQQARVDWRRQIDVVQNFVCERIVPLLAVCSRGPSEEALVRLTFLLGHQPQTLSNRCPPCSGYAASKSVSECTLCSNADVSICRSSERCLQGPLTGQALSMLSAEAGQEWEEVVRVLQQAAGVLEGAALDTRQLNADLSATQVQLRASEFELKALRTEHAAAQRRLEAHQREARYHQQVCSATDFSCHAILHVVVCRI